MAGDTAIAVDFGGTSIKIGVTRGESVLERAEPLPTQDYGSPGEIIKAMNAAISPLLAKYPSAVAVGLGMPGWVDFYRGVLYQLTNVPVWDHEVPVKVMMQEALGLPVALDNDANCMAYAEWKLGAGMGLQSLACLTLGTGVGGGIVLNGRMLRGRNVSAAELGQTSIMYNGRVGPFGNRGAIEEYIGNREMAHDAAKAYAAAGMCRKEEDCTPLKLERAARAGDAIARQAYADFAEKLACLIMNLMYTLTPEAFIVGGGVARAGELLFEPLRDCLKRQLFHVHYQNLRILPARFGADSGLVGAGLMAADYAHGRIP